MKFLPNAQPGELKPDKKATCHDAAKFGQNKIFSLIFGFLAAAKSLGRPCTTAKFSFTKHFIPSR